MQLRNVFLKILHFKKTSLSFVGIVFVQIRKKIDLSQNCDGLYIYASKRKNSKYISAFFVYQTILMLI